MSCYDYMMLKPESQKDFDKILNLTEKSSFDVVDFYRVNDWKTVSEALYNDQFNENINFKLTFQSLAYTINSLFGNKGIILLIRNGEDISNEVFAQKVVAFKHIVRDMFCKAKEIFLVSNISQMPLDRYGIANNGTLKIEDKDGKIKEISRCREEGLYKFHSLSYIHTPDADIRRVCVELKILEDLGVLTPNNIIGKSELVKMRKYGTFNTNIGVEKTDFEIE